MKTHFAFFAFLWAIQSHADAPVFYSDPAKVRESDYVAVSISDIDKDVRKFDRKKVRVKGWIFTEPRTRVWLEERGKAKGSPSIELVLSTNHYYWNDGMRFYVEYGGKAVEIFGTTEIRERESKWNFEWIEVDKITFIK